MSKDLPPSRTAEQFVVRFPDGMRDRISEEAKKNNRSMNAEIVSRLEDSFVAPPGDNQKLELAEALIRLTGYGLNQITSPKQGESKDAEAVKSSLRKLGALLLRSEVEEATTEALKVVESAGKPRL